MNLKNRNKKLHKEKVKIKKLEKSNARNNTAKAKSY